MSESLHQQLALIKEELDAERMDEAHIEALFLKLRKQVEDVLSGGAHSPEEKAKELRAVSDVLNLYEKEAKQQKSLIQEGLKKLTKGRRSMKEYKENTR